MLIMHCALYKNQYDSEEVSLYFNFADTDKLARPEVACYDSQ